MSFTKFINEIPASIHARTKTFITDDIAIFKPDKFVVEQQMVMADYHFVLFYCHSPLVMINGREFKFNKGTLVSFEPGTEIAVCQDETNEISRYISISVKKNYMEQIAQRVLEGKKIEFSELGNKYSTQLIMAINNLEFEIINYGYPIMIDNLTEQIAFLLLRDSMPDILGKITATDFDNDCLTKALEYMRENFSGDISIEDICKEIYLSTSYFKRLFKSRIGTTPYRYLIQLRIECAKRILERDFFSVDETASRCGFSNSGHLSTVFRKFEGISPSEFRKKSQKEARGG